MEYFYHILILVAIWSILSLSLNLLLGFTGLISFAHAGFFGIGAYTTAILMRDHGWNFFWTVPLAMFFALLASMPVGAVLARFKGDYYALVSIGFNMILTSIMLNWQSLTGGPLGVAGIQRPHLFNLDFYHNQNFLVLSLFFLLVTFFAIKYITDSSFGRALKAIREDEEGLQIFGYSTHFYKLIVFGIGAAFAGLAGTLYATFVGFIAPAAFFIPSSVIVLSMVILGGLGTNRGSIVGAVLLTIFPELLRFVGFSADIAAQMRLLSYGLLLILFMMYRPRGILGEFKL